MMTLTIVVVWFKLHKYYRAKVYIYLQQPSGKDGTLSLYHSSGHQ